MRFFREGSHWRQVNLATEDHHVVRHVDLSSLSEAEQAAAVREEERTLRRSIDVSTGPLIRVAVFSRGPRADILMLLVHHLVVDGYSWSILMEDLETLYGRLLAGKMPSLPAKTTSFKTWSETLAAFAKSAQAADELPFWLGLPANHVQHLPVDYPDAVDPGERAGVATTILSPFETTALVRSVPTDHKARLSDIIVTALARALAAWTGAPVQAMDVNSHGREPVFPNVDLSRTVGWFVTRYPVVINLGSASEPVESLQTVKRQLLAIPRSGLGYGILRHLSPYGSCLDAIDVLPEFHLNYQGQLDLLFARMSLFKPIQEPSRPPKRWLPQTTRRVFARIRLREKQLELAFAYSRRSYEPSTIDHFVGLVAAELQCLIASSTRQPFDNTE
jgi:non-ribosomal peptide synthase protein (TIGR01720 family)